MKSSGTFFLLFISLALYSSDADSLLQLGHQQFRLNAYMTASHHYQKAYEHYLKLDDSVSAANCLQKIASCYEKSGWDYLPKYRQASIMFDALDIKNVYSGVAKLKLGEYREAVAILKTLEANSINLCWTAVGYRLLQQYDSAIYYYQKAIPLPRNRRQEWPYQDLGLVYREMGEYNLAQNYFEQAIAHIQPADSAQLFDTYTGLGEMYLKQGKYRKAIGAFMRIPITGRSNFVVVERNREGLKEAETQARVARTERLLLSMFAALVLISGTIWYNWKKIMELRTRMVFIEQYSNMLFTMLGFANSNIKHHNLEEATKDVEAAQKMIKSLKDRAS